MPGRTAVPLRLPPIDELERLQREWTYGLRNRKRWAGSAKHGVVDPDEEVTRFLETVGVTADVARAVAGSGLVEVSLPGDGGHAAEVARRLPWEWILATATRPYRGRSLNVVRHLRLPGRRVPGLEVPSWWYVESAVRQLRELYEFGAERDLVRQAAAMHERRLGGLILDPTSAELASAFERVDDDDVIHVAGFEVRQTVQLVEEVGRSIGTTMPGLVVTTRSGVASIVGANELLSHLVRPEARPRLVAFNLHHSAYDFAAEAVRRGADTAIGFQDSFDEALAEQFFATFYGAWQLAGLATAAAFRYAWQTIKATGQPLQGSGIVLWSARSIADGPPRSVRTAAAPWEVAEIDRAWEAAIDERSPGDDGIAAGLAIHVHPYPALNYSHLHNGGALFERFTIAKRSPWLGRVDDLTVEVCLNVGSESFPFRMTCALGPREPQVDLRDRVCISLADALTRGLRERVRTTLFVEVRWRERVLHRTTQSVTLLPVDEWTDTDAHRIWLPSFVQPRDPGVLRVLGAAERYLKAICDDPTAGFDGYQAVEYTDVVALAGPKCGELCARVDKQVQALWSALLHELPLSYVNPPPSTSLTTQRLRFPHEIIEGGRGTCIDLALLLASCLEYVDIYPTVLLLPGHAMAGYWRHEELHAAFVASTMGRAPALARVTDDGAGQRYGWYLERPQAAEVHRAIVQGHLVPIEAVGLTSRIPFAEAQAQARAQLQNVARFEAMLDVMLARRNPRSPVTPLPILTSPR
jgi:hypothetical protein